MWKSLLLRLNGFSITVLYEGGGRQQVTIPGPCSGRIQRRKEIPEVTKKEGRKQRRQTHGQGEDDDNGAQRGGHMRGSRDEKLKEKGWSVLLRLIFF